MYSPPALVFDSFAPTPGNAAAIDFARRVAHDRPDAPALLVLHGPNGAGKTHLLSAIGAARRACASDPAPCIEYVTLRELLDHVRAAASWANGGTHASRYAVVDLLLIDDAQAAVRSPVLQAEFAQLLETGKIGRCVVVAADCPPAAIAAGEPRLVRLFGAATVCEVEPPGAARRVRATPADVARHVPSALPAAVVPAGPHLTGEPLAPFATDADAREAHPPGAVWPPDPAGATCGETPTDFASFLSDVVAAVAQHVEPWKQQLAEASDRWGALGYSVAVLERALARSRAPNVEGLLATYSAAVDHLRRLESQAVAIDPALGRAPAFLDPERVADAEAAVARLLPAGPDAHLTRAAFEVGGSNADAARIADLAIAAPATAANPVYVHGPSGSGRTHLVCAVANALRGWRSGRVGYVTTPLLADELATAVRGGAVERWRARYVALDVLAIDDLQHAVGQPQLEQEIALLCAALRERGAQVLLAGEPGIEPSGGLGDALRREIARGAAVLIDAPDRDLLARQLARHLAMRHRDVDPMVIAYLAERAEQSAHALTPVADRLLTAADRAGVPLTLAFARSELGRTPARTPLSAVAGDARAGTFFLDVEKVVWDWPDVAGRAIEELR